MAMQKVGASGEIFKFEDVGTTLEGYLVGKGKKRFDGDDYDRNEYFVKTSNGTVRFVGSKKIDDALPGIPVGTRIRMTYTELARLKGGKTCKLFDIEFDPSDVINVAS